MRLIDAEELMIKLQWHCDLNCPYTEQERQKTDICDTCLLGDAKDYIDSMPTVETEPIRYGHWIDHNYKEFPIGRYECSACGAKHDMEWDYCPNCGACMERISNDNETSSSVYESIKQGLEDAINGDVRKSVISNG